MRKKIMILLLIPIIAILNYSIYQKEQVKKYGETILIELVPADPRSLIQGDYMVLRYSIEMDVSLAQELMPREKQKDGYIVIYPDEKNIAKFIRIYKGENPSKGEKLLHFHRWGSSIEIVPNSFFFQEDHSKYYQNARYGIFKFDNSGNYLLVGLADSDRQEIIAKY